MPAVHPADLRSGHRRDTKNRVWNQRCQLMWRLWKHSPCSQPPGFSQQEQKELVREQAEIGGKRGGVNLETPRSALSVRLNSMQMSQPQTITQRGAGSAWEGLIQ